MHLSTFDNTVVSHIAWNRRTVINRPMELEVLVYNIQIILFTLQGMSRGFKGLLLDK